MGQGGFTCNDGSAIDASIKGCGSAQCQSAAKSAGKCAGSTCSDAELDDWAKAKHDNKLPSGMIHLHMMTPVLGEGVGTVILLSSFDLFSRHVHDFEAAM